nr:MAG TPA: tail fiber protein [Caudoviricetes sp.]
MTAIRTIEYTASPSGVKPIAPQDAGVRGEHKATNVVFNLDASLIKPEYKYRFEYVDGFSGFDTTEFVQPVGSTVSILLPVEWTAGGGCGTLRLCIVALDSQSNEEQTVYTFPASLLFAERETGGECNYKKGLSALIDSAGKATDAANEAAENANAAADRVDESVSSANTAAANANRAAASADASAATAMSAAGTATTAAGAANTAASQAQAAKAAADTAASGADASAEQARTAAANANTAAGTANTAASNANAIAQTVQAKLDAGELKGEKGDKGDTGPEGPQGVSGVYVGGGDMPEGYSVQVDPAGDMLCYTAGESDSRYANVLTGTASGPVAALEDVSPTGALRRAAVLGATAETGSGDKGPDNPYTLAGVQPTKVTVCGRNLAANPRFNAADQFSPCVYADCELQPNTKYTISLYVPAGEAYYTNENLFVKVVYLPVSNGGIYSAVVTTKPTISNTDPRQYAAGKGWILLKVQSGTTASGNARDLQIEFGDTAAPYEPYTGQTITLSALEPLYGDETVCDEYDVVSGVETRRWKRVVFDGTESMRCEAHGNGQRYVSIDLDAAANKSVMPISTHYTSSAWTQDNNKVYIPNPVVMVITDSRFTTLQAARDILAAQYAAGTPVTVVYQLAEPVITQHDPARILPPAPVCRVFADAGGVDVGYNRDINIAFEQQQAEYIAQIKALDARIAKLETGQPAEPMT